MFSEKLKELRREQNVSQENLGKVLGYSRTAISAYELGRNEPSFSELIKIADFFNVSIDYLLGRTNKPQENNHAKKTEGIPLTPQQKEVIASLSPAQRQEMIAFAEYLRSKQA